MIRLKEQGLSYAQIGDVYGISRQRVYQIVSKGKKNYPTMTIKSPSTAPRGSRKGIKKVLRGITREN